jgi:hypothetical protein
MENINYTDNGYQSSKIKRYIKIGFLVFIALFIYFHYFVYWDLSDGCYIRIKPAFFEFTNLDMKRALVALKIASPEDYRLVCDNVGSIEPMIGCGGFGGGCFYNSSDKSLSNARQITVSTAKNDLQTAMLVIVHETCHAIQEKEGRSLDEDECYRLDDKLLRKTVVF